MTIPLGIAQLCTVHSYLAPFFLKTKKTCRNFFFLLRWQTPHCTVCCQWCPDSGWCSLCGSTIFRWSRPQLWVSPKVTVALFETTHSPWILSYRLQVVNFSLQYTTNSFFFLFLGGLCQQGMVRVLLTSLSLWKTWSDMLETKWTSQITQHQSKYGKINK